MGELVPIEYIDPWDEMSLYSKGCHNWFSCFSHITVVPLHTQSTLRANLL